MRSKTDALALTLFSLSPALAPALARADEQQDRLAVLNNPAIQDAIRGGSSTLVHTVVPLGFFVFILGLVYISHSMRYRKLQLLQQTARLMVEKGMQVPPELIVPARMRSDGRRGTNLIFLGLAISICLYISEPGQTNWVWGLIPLSLGLGNVLNTVLDRRKT
jgi:hypothetical protein